MDNEDYNCKLTKEFRKLINDFIVTPLTGELQYNFKLPLNIDNTFYTKFLAALNADIAHTRQNEQRREVMDFENIYIFLSNLINEVLQKKQQENPEYKKKFFKNTRQK